MAGSSGRNTVRGPHQPGIKRTAGSTSPTSSNAIRGELVVFMDVKLDGPPAFRDLDVCSAMVQKQTKCDWDVLPVITAVARAGTLRGAAKAIGVSHSTVLRQLAAAEAALGSALFT